MTICNKIFDYINEVAIEAQKTKENYDECATGVVHTQVIWVKKLEYTRIKDILEELFDRLPIEDNISYYLTTDNDSLEISVSDFTGKRYIINITRIECSK